MDFRKYGPMRRPSIGDYARQVRKAIFSSGHDPWRSAAGQIIDIQSVPQGLSMTKRQEPSA